MGMYESYSNTIHPSGTDDLGECTACKGTGWVAYPVNVGVDLNEYDECPHGCRPMDENERRDFQVRRQPVPMYTILDEFHDAYYRSLGDTFWADTLVRMAQGPRTRALVGWKYTEGPKPKGRVTTDVVVMGLVEGLHDRVYPATIPAYLPGLVMNAEPLTVLYEYLGATVRVRFAETEASFFRFAHPWDDGYSTAELL
jgi:hypothetical protein